MARVVSPQAMTRLQTTGMTRATWSTTMTLISKYLPTTHLEKVESNPYKHENGAHEIQASLDHFLQTTFVEVYDKYGGPTPSLRIPH